MCGIFIVLTSSNEVDRPRFIKARDQQTHRGPDAEGSIFLQNGRVAIGHRRLSILDLSSAANQPMRLESSWISFNGEIYNYESLRTELEKMGCRFATHSDTEVLLHGYRIWGQEVCQHLEGMFAFAIWNDNTREMFLARDHVGQKPLYYAELGNEFLISSEIKSIQYYLRKELTLRNESLLDFYIYDCVPEPYTWFREVFCVPPGHCMKVSYKNEYIENKLIKYWGYTPNPDPEPITTPNAMEIMAEKINYAVSSHMISDVEVGAFLSGGADSTCIVTLASEIANHPLKTFSIGFDSPEGDELPIVKKTINRLHTTHRQEIVKSEDFRKSINHVLDIFDFPFADTSLVPTERVSALAARDVKVVLTGDGGDEVFGGYNYGWFISPFLASRFGDKFTCTNIKAKLLFMWDKLFYSIYGASGWQAKANFLHRMGSRKNALNKIGESMRSALLNYDLFWAYNNHKNSNLDPFREAQWLNLKIHLPSKLLVKVDRCSMQHSLETRAPFLSHHLIECMLDMPTTVRNPNVDWYKGLFRAWLKNKISDDVLNAPKRGFSTPAHWNPVNTNEHDGKLLSSCINVGAINSEIIPDINKNPKLLWKYLQIENALNEKKLFSVINK